MKVLFLNCWQGKHESRLLQYISEQARDTEIFCLQEVTPDLQQNLSKILRNYQVDYRFIKVSNNFTQYYGQSVFVKKNIYIEKMEVIEIFKNRKPNYGFLQVIDLLYKGKMISVGNLHGRSQPGHKLDTKTRLNQSKIILETFNKIQGLKIFGGDFNLEPKTKSIKMITDCGYLDLIKKYNIKTTRNELAWKSSKENGSKGIVKYYKKQYFADYCFVSHDVKVKSFIVTDHYVSDHLPLVLEFYCS